jgi:hypothetical protein
MVRQGQERALELRKTLLSARVGDTLRVRFIAGSERRGAKGTITQDEQVALIRFMALAGSLQPEDQRRFQFGKATGTDSFAHDLTVATLYCVAQSGRWEHVARTYTVTVLRDIGEEDAQSYAARIGDVLDELNIVASGTPATPAREPSTVEPPSPPAPHFTRLFACVGPVTTPPTCSVCGSANVSHFESETTDSRHRHDFSCPDHVTATSTAWQCGR